MRFIQSHALVHFLSSVGTSSDGLNICLVIVRAALIGVVQRGGFSSHEIYTRLMAWLASDQWVVLF